MTYHNSTASHRVGDGHYLAPGRGRGIGAVPGLISPVLGGGMRGLGDDLAKAQLKRQRAIAQGLPDPGIPLMISINAAAANALKVVAPAIRAAPILTPGDKAELLSAPIDWFLDIFDPIEDAVGRAVDSVLSQKGDVQNYFGFKMNLKRVQGIDTKADPSTRNLLKRLRTILAFLVLPMTQPIEFAAALIREGIQIAGSIFKPVSGYGGGLGVAGGDDAAAAAGAAATEAGSTALTAAISSAITAIVGAVSAALTKAATDAINPPAPTTANVPVTAPPFRTTDTPVIVTAPPASSSGSSPAISPTLIFVGAAALAFVFLSR